MTDRKLFLFITRIFFILFSILFIDSALPKWDKYSYYIQFTEFLPDLSLTYIVWTAFSTVLAFAFWFIIYILCKISPISLKSTYLEKLISKINSSITPLVWLFAFLLVLAVPMSIQKGSHDTGPIKTNSADERLINPKRPNIILVVMDSLAAQNMQSYGYYRPTTPFIDKWAKDSIFFSKVYASSNWTTPATMSLMTGQRPWTHKTWYRAEFDPGRNYKYSLPNVLRDNGYVLYSFVQNNHAHPRTLGIDSVFLTKDKAHTFWIPETWWARKLASFYENRRIAAEWIFKKNYFVNKFFKDFRHPIYSSTVLSGPVYDRFFEQVPVNREKPFFAWLHMYPPHDLYLPPEPFKDYFGKEEKYNTGDEQYYSGLFHSDFDPQRQADVDIMRKHYDEFILYSDKQFELFLSRLAEQYELSNTIIILTSDHGESFSNGFFGHDGPHLYESLVHVPLIIKIPRETRGKAIDMNVEQIDIAPTILEIAGIQAPEWMEGRSLLPLIENRVLEPRPLISMNLFTNRATGNHPITKGTVAVWDNGYKLVRYLKLNKFHLFNIAGDPHEKEDLIDKKPEIALRLKKIIESKLAIVNTKIMQRAKK